MRNKVQLYIGGKRADLDDGSFILFTYTAEELTNPTIVRNSFSRQITLKGTPANDEIFGHIYRNDRLTEYGGGMTGPDFDPCRKTAFVIYNEMMEILESGYLKLDGIVTTRKKHEYKVTLFGGLGSFLYGLSYDASGDKLSLADLDFGETLDFTINRAAISDAWARIGGDTTKPAKWDIINFAPGYMGLPPSPFSAEKCYVYPLFTGLKSSDETGMYKASPATIVTLNEKVTGIAARDYRSYLQKPCIKVSAVIDAICDPSNNGGWTVNQDADFFNNINPYWNDAWMTLPALYDLNVNDSETSSSQTMTALDTKLPIVGGGGDGTYKVTLQATPVADMTGLPATDYRLWCANANGITVNHLQIILTLYDSSQVELVSATYNITSDRASFPASIPAPDFTFDHIDQYGHFVDSNGNDVVFPIYAEAQGAAYYMVHVDCANHYAGSISGNPGDLSWYMWPITETVFTNYYRFDPQLNSPQVDIIGKTSSTVRTGATITKAMLLGGGHTPADYLLSYCKMFGIQIVAHKDSKTVDLVLRKNFYTSSVVDINQRIDRGREITKTPFAFDARWYTFGNDAKGEFADYYQNRYTRPFGQFRVNTGYEFDAEEKNMTDSIIFGNLCSLVEASPYFCTLQNGGKNIPSVFLAGGEYVLYRGSETMTLSLPYLADAAKTWDNTSWPMHDWIERLQIHGENDAHIDERDTLVLFGGMVDTSAMHLTLSDDTEAVLALNGNNPCWMPFYCDVDSSWRIDSMPMFSRYVWSGTTINMTLDFGDPEELQIPWADLGVSSNIFDNWWAKYIGDRYDDDSAVVTAYVDLRGMQVGNDLLRRFYAFDGAIWALNKIIDHSLTTFGPTKCEFVKVQDITNYTTL